jgi:drug/metabolite transporter (DMT)-like permease
MNMLLTPPRPARPAPWAIPLAFTLVYLAWGTTYLAIRWGVRDFPPALFGGARIGLAGLVLMAFLGWRGESLQLSRRDLYWALVLGVIFFVGGNWLVTLGVKSVPSGVAAILVATTPLWTALLETCWPGGERLSGRGWIGLLVGLAGVIVLKLDQPPDQESTLGALLIILSAMAWAFGSVLLRRHRQHGSHLVCAAWQMVLGGLALCLAGLAIGEASQLSTDKFTPEGVYAFFHLLVFGSLVGFVAYNWLLGHVSTAHASTYAYVNPVVALLVGWLLADHGLSVAMVAGMCIILTAVALVRSQNKKASRERQRPGEVSTIATSSGR